jgi:hypothetical protein
MNFALIYLIHRFFYRLLDFFQHWYIGGSRRFAHSFISFLERLDEVFAVKITIEYFFHPLYKDYSIVGRILGIIFRSFRILIGGAVYILVGLVFLIVYLGWLAVPPIIIFYTFKNIK